MKISNISRVYDVYQGTKATATEKVGKHEDKKDSFKLSSTAQDFQTTLKALSQIPDIREDKVNAVKSKIQSNNYNVSADQIASKIVSNAFDKKI